jgi:hypothetical protein
MGCVKATVINDRTQHRPLSALRRPHGLVRMYLPKSNDREGRNGCAFPILLFFCLILSGGRLLGKAQLSGSALKKEDLGAKRPNQHGTARGAASNSADHGLVRQLASFARLGGAPFS